MRTSLENSDHNALHLNFLLFEKNIFEFILINPSSSSSEHSEFMIGSYKMFKFIRFLWRQTGYRLKKQRKKAVSVSELKSRTLDRPAVFSLLGFREGIWRQPLFNVDVGGANAGQYGRRTFNVTSAVQNPKGGVRVHPSRLHLSLTAKPKEVYMCPKHLH